MKIGDKTTYEQDDFIYQAEVVAEKKDGTTIIISVPALGKCVEIENK